MPEEHEARPKKRATGADAGSGASATGSARKKAAGAAKTPAHPEHVETAEAPVRKRGTRKPAPEPRPAEDEPSTETVAASEAVAGPAEESLTPAATATDDAPAENPLHKKLGLRPDSVGAVVAPPEADDNPLLPLPDGLVVLSGLDEVATIAGPCDYIHVFARSRGDLAGAFATLRDRLSSGGSLWVSWMKQSSDRRRGVFTDLNETIIRRIALTHGMVDVKVVALDRDWSALRLVHRKH